MAKGYWVTVYRSISDPKKLEAYAKLAPLATAPFGGRYLARASATTSFDRYCSSKANSWSMC